MSLPLTFHRLQYLSPCFGVAILCAAAGCGDEQGSAGTMAESADTARSEHGHSHDGDADHSHEPSGGTGDEHGHSHTRDKMLITDAGSMHALLTAHLAAAGNELDIFFETPVSDDPKPVALELSQIEAQATAGEGDAQTLIFEPAPAEERPPGEAAGTCSHFVASAPWMKPDMELLVVAKFTVAGEEITARWKGFSPAKYAHHVETSGATP